MKKLPIFPAPIINIFIDAVILFLAVLVVDDFYLLAHTLFVYVFKNLRDKLWRHTQQRTLRATLVQNFRIAVGLEYSHVVLLFVLTYLAAYTHSLRQKVH